MELKRLEHVTEIANAYLESCSGTKIVLTKEQVLEICKEISTYCQLRYGVDDSYIMEEYTPLDLGSDVYGYVMNGGIVF